MPLFSKRDLKTFLEEISVEAKFMTFEFVSTENFTIELKCKVETDATPQFYSTYSAEWIRKFSKFTATTWIVRNCFSKLKRLLYRKIYACHRSAHNKKKKPHFESRNQDCRAKIEFRMKFINRNTIKNDPLLKEGLNLTISIDFSHTHKVRAREAFTLLKSTSETDSIFNEYFATGCTPAVAKLYHELTLLDKYGEDCSEVLSNATINPSLRHVLYIYGKRKKGVDNSNIRATMDVKKERLENEGFTLSYSNDELTRIVIVTPLMKQVIAEFGLDHVIVDSTQVSNGPIVTLFYVPSIIGALPVASVIHMGDTETDYCEAFLSVKAALEVEYNNEFEPKVCMVNKTELNVIATFCDKTKVMLSRYSLSSEAWQWLNYDDNKVERKKRHGIMVSIKTLLYSDAESIDNAYLKVKEIDSIQSTPKLTQYIDSLWEKRDQWLVDDKVSNLTEASIRFIKEFITKRCKSFNNIIMVDVVTKILENHQRRIIASYIKDTNTTAVYTKFLTKAQIVLGFGSEVRRISANEYKVDCQQTPKKYFRTDTMCCDCQNGKKGQFCEHLCAIINIVETDAMKTPNLTEDENNLFHKLVGDIEDESHVIKPEAEDVEDDNTEDKEDIEKDNTNETIESDRFDEPLESSQKLDYYYYLEVKSERCDPLENETVDDIDDSTTDIVKRNVPNSKDNVKNYETALKAVNDEFRRLNRFFSENPNSTNLETMTRLARELSKIRPVEEVNLGNMKLKVNTRKRKCK